MKYQHKPKPVVVEPRPLDSTAKATLHAVDLAHRYTERRGDRVALPLKDGRVVAGRFIGATPTHVLLSTGWFAVADIKT